MTNSPVKRVVILGGGTAGWLAAAMLAKTWGRTLELVLVESEEIGTVGVGEATIPPLTKLMQYLGIDEDQLLSRIQGTFKLGIEFIDWHETGQSYIHAFGNVGQPLGILPFYQYWLRQKQGGADVRPLGDYSLATLAARAGKFARMDRIPETNLDGIDYAFHFDAGLLAQFLRIGCENSGVVRREGKVAGVNLRSADGFIESLTLAGGEVISGDLFIDCSGFGGVLIEGALHAGYETWTHWLPCDRAIAVPSAPGPELRPYTQARAHTAGWQWRISLQHRTGNGHVFSSAFMSADDATAILMANLEGAPLAEPRELRFTTGRRRQSWVKNCVALGLASGFMEPLESTSIHLVQSGMTRFLRLFPDTGFSPIEIAEYNRQTANEYERIRDFLILHYKATKRDDSDFWKTCRDMEIPDSLAHKLDYFAEHGRLLIDDDDIFKDSNWSQVLIGQGVMPRSRSPLTDAVDAAALGEFMINLRAIYERTVAGLPSHADYVAGHCAARS